MDGYEMNDYEKICNNLMNQGDWLLAVNKLPNRVILGVEIAKILDTYHKNCYLEYKPSDGSFLFMGLPVTVDYQDRWIMMVCTGNESDGRYVLRKE